MASACREAWSAFEFERDRGGPMSAATNARARDTTPARSLPGAVQRFIETEAAGGVVLLAAAVAALAWANSPWQHSYRSLWGSPVIFRLGGIRVAEDLRHLINDGLMAVFFF